MYAGKRFLGLIPARGGSEGVPGKNMRTVKGKPLITYALEKASRAPLLDRVIVSTDRLEIADMARAHGADVPFIREAHLAESKTPLLPVIVDAVQRTAERGAAYDYCVVLQANSPLTRETTIEEVIRKIADEDLDVVFTVCPAGHPPQWSLRITAGTPDFAFLSDAGQPIHRRQEEEILFRSTGAVFAVKVSYLLDHPGTARLCLPAKEQKTGVVLTDALHSIDVDTEDDFMIAQVLLELIGE